MDELFGVLIGICLVALIAMCIGLFNINDRLHEIKRELQIARKGSEDKE